MTSKPTSLEGSRRRGWSLGRWPRFSAAAAALTLSAVPSTAQRLSPGEVRISSSPYPPPSPVVRVESRLVYLRVVVRDSRARPVAGLRRRDFAVFDSGRRRQVATFSVEQSNGKIAAPTSEGASAAPSALNPTGAPQQPQGTGRWVGLFFDDINTPPADLAQAKVAARHFIQEAAASGSQVGLFTTSGGQILPFSGNAGEMLKSLATITSHPRMSAGGGMSCPGITPLEAYRIVKGDPSAISEKDFEACSCPGLSLCDSPGGSGMTLAGPRMGSPAADYVQGRARAIWNQALLVAQATLDAISSAVGRLAQMPGERVLLFASSGFLSGGDLLPEVNEIANEAVRAGLVINSLDAKGLYTLAPGGPISEPPENLSSQAFLRKTIYEAQTLGDEQESEDEAMANLAESTGGLFFRNNNDLDFGFRELGLAPTTSYVLGFRPEQDGKYHKIKIEVSNARHDFIQARPGYFAPAIEAKEASGPTPQQAIDREVRSSEPRNDFPLTVSKAPALNGSGKLSILTHVGIATLPFGTRRARRIEELTFVGALFNAQGTLVAGKEAHMVFAFKKQTFERFRKTGISAEMTLDAPRGIYRLRVVAEEPVGGEISATSYRVQIP